MKYQFFTYSIFLFFSIFFTYRNLFQTYFQGDEWYYGQLFLPFTKSLSGLFASIPYSIVNLNVISGGGHLTPISNFLIPFSLMLFGFNFFYYALTSLLIHLFNSLCVSIISWKLIPSSKKIGAIAGIFFALTQAPSESVTWSFFYHSASLSVTFFLLATIRLITIPLNKRPKRIQLIQLILLSLGALLTKETTVILIPFFIFYLLLNLKKRSFLAIIHSQISWAIAIITSLYLPFRLFIPYLSTKTTITDSNADVLFNLPLMIFRIITYPLKTITQVFIPAPPIISSVENLTPLAYPYFAIEQEVRGTNYLMFIQTAGSDMIIYFCSLILIFAFTLLLHKLKNDKTNFNTLILTATIIPLSSIPLLFIAFFAPNAAYVTFLDSRHLYLPSVGAAIIFAIAVSTLSDSILYLKKYSTFTMILLVGIWSLWNFNLIQQDLTKKVSFGQDRTNLINEIFSTIKSPSKKIVIHIESDSSYYGFAELMPPFQTNFGQVMADHLYQKNLLTQELLDTSNLTLKGINAQGYKEANGYGFGYYLSLNKVSRLIEQGKISPEELYSFKWEGKKHQASTITDDSRKKLYILLEEGEKFKSWQKVTIPEFNLSFKIPPKAVKKESTPTDDQTVLFTKIFSSEESTYQFRIIKRTGNTGIYEDISLLNNSEGQLIRDNFYYRTVKMKSGENQTIKITSTGSSTKMFLPTLFPDKIIELTVLNEPSLQNKILPEAELILSQIQYPENEDISVQ